MARTIDSQPPRHLRVVPREAPRPAPVLRPNAPVSPADDALLTTIARRARDGDRAARDLLWRAFAPRLEPALRRVGRMVYQRHWVWRDERPWDLDDLRQEGWLAFAELVADWHGEGSIVPYMTAYFPWRLVKAMRRLGPLPRRASLAGAWSVAADDELDEAECAALRAAITDALSPLDATILALRIQNDLSLGTIARRLGMSRRTAYRRWRRIRRIAAAMLRPDASPADE
jgi:RNA polymerase sigma factor (sigma-70 family)